MVQQVDSNTGQQSLRRVAPHQGSPEASWPLVLSFLDLPISQKMQLKLSSKIRQTEKCRMHSYT